MWAREMCVCTCSHPEPSKYAYAHMLKISHVPSPLRIPPVQRWEQAPCLCPVHLFTSHSWDRHPLRTSRSGGERWPWNVSVQYQILATSSLSASEEIFAIGVPGPRPQRLIDSGLGKAQALEIFSVASMIFFSTVPALRMTKDGWVSLVSVRTDLSPGNSVCSDLIT